MSDQPKRALALTPELVALTVRKVDDPGSHENVVYFGEADYEMILADLLAGRPAGDVWLFAVGSLIWNPACDFVEQRLGTMRGWHRAFCLGWDTRWRGSKEQPGLMMGLDRGGQCTGVLYRLAPDRLESSLGMLLRREMRMKPPPGKPATQTGRWLKVEADGGPFKALTFVLDRNGVGYRGKLPDEQIADVLARACGSVGSGAEYLHNTVAKLAEHGIYDRNLWRLQELVAERIRLLHGDDAGRRN